MASTIDRGIPVAGTDVDAPEIQGNFNAAANDIEALQTGKEDVGVAATLDSQHVAAPDPHGDRAYSDGELSTHVGAADPHGDRAFAAAEVDAHVAAGEHTQYAAIAHVGATGAAHGLASALVNGFLSSTLWSKLDGIDAGLVVESEATAGAVTQAETLVIITQAGYNALGAGRPAGTAYMIVG